MEVNSSLEDELNGQGLFIDDVHRLRILDPSIADQTTHLKQECDQFLSATRRFDTLVESFKIEASQIANTVEKEKRRAIGFRLLLDALRKKKEEDQRRLMALVDQKRIELEQLKMETEMFNKANQFHQEMLDNFHMLH